jgi:hypothetical protein
MQGPLKFTQIWIFVFKIYHLATLWSGDGGFNQNPSGVIVTELIKRLKEAAEKGCITKRLLLQI